jgi:AcrR family transcriptional regulator
LLVSLVATATRLVRKRPVAASPENHPARSDVLVTRSLFWSEVMKRATARRDDIRDLILDGVDVLLARYGFRKMTMADLARQVGIGKGTLYLHFPSKDELVLSHVDRLSDRVVRRLRDVAASCAPPAERLRRMLIERVLLRFDAVTHYSESLNELLSSLRGELVARRRGHFEREARVLAGVLRDAAPAGPPRRGRRPLDEARSLVWCTNALLPFSLSTRELGERAEMEARVRAIADILIRGLMPSERGQRRRPERRRPTTTSTPAGPLMAR